MESSIVSFSISASEIEEMVWKNIWTKDMGDILSYIENDEILWDAIEDAKKSAIRYVLGEVNFY